GGHAGESRDMLSPNPPPRSARPFLEERESRLAPATFTPQPATPDGAALSLRDAIVQADSIFFSSRRRHTRLVSDWSSDVCSSYLELVRCDQSLVEGPAGRQLEVLPGRPHRHPGPACLGSRPGDPDLQGLLGDDLVLALVLTVGRSEERRVGKEWRSHAATRRRADK